jgi:Fur family peroxide stress response transcriptional regulator
MPADEGTATSRMNAFMRVCRRSGIRATHQRREIFREVARMDEHPDAETIYKRVRKRMPTISLDTIYRTLSLLEEKGLIRRLELFSGRTRYDANTESHHHVICTRCGLVRDFESGQMDVLAPPEQVRSWGEVHSAHVQLRGICSGCLARRGEGSGQQ